MKSKTWFSLLIAVGAVLSAPVVQGAIQVPVLGYNTMPFYARIAAGPFYNPPDPYGEEVYHNDEWVAIVFYRDPECVPADFNLFELFDGTEDPNYGLRPFGCPATVGGFELWEHGLGLDPAPFHAQLAGLGAVPVWFVSWTEIKKILEAGRPTPSLTIEDLKKPEMNLRKGVASFYAESLHSYPAAQVPHITIEARGNTQDGKSFVFKATGSGLVQICCSPETPRTQLQIRFW